MFFYFGVALLHDMKSFEILFFNLSFYQGVKAALQSTSTMNGKIIIYGTPAEETGGGKAEMSFRCMYA